MALISVSRWELGCKLVLSAARISALALEIKNPAPLFPKSSFQKKKSFSNRRINGTGILPNVCYNLLGNDVAIKNLIPENAFTASFPHMLSSISNNRLTLNILFRIISSNPICRGKAFIKSYMHIIIIANNPPKRLNFNTVLKEVIGSFILQVT